MAYMYYYIYMDGINILTEREIKILSLIIEGKSNPEIADELIISIHTVKVHIESIYRKLGVHNKVQAAVYAILNHTIEEHTKISRKRKVGLDYTEQDN